MTPKIYLLIGLLLGLVFGVVIEADAEVLFGVDTVSHYFVFDRVLPQQIINVLNSTPEVVDMEVGDESTQVWYNITYSNNTQYEIESYVFGLDYLFTRNEYSTLTFPDYPFPNCFWDYGTNQKVGVYWFNSEQVVIQNDSKCFTK